MADPLSVAGSAVGVVSLGLTVCQSLISYYGSWRAYDEEISSVTRKAEGLKTTLEALQNPLRKLESANAMEILEVHKGILACAETLHKLRKTAEKCKAIRPPSAFKPNFQALGKRTLYPFRRDTLLWLKDTLEGLQNNLNTAILVLQLCDKNQNRNAKTSADTSQNRTAIYSQMEKTEWLGSVSISAQAGNKDICERLKNIDERTATILKILPSIQETTKVANLISNGYEKRFNDMARTLRIHQVVHAYRKTGVID
jgi:hypothetical protein